MLDAQREALAAAGAERVPALDVEVLDTTGCGDAQGLGGDAGEFDLAGARRFAAGAPMR